MRRIGELLVAEGLISEAAINRALGYQRVSGERIKLGSILLNWDLLAEEALLETLAKFHRCPAVTGETLAASPAELVRLLSPAQAARLAAIPYAMERNLLRVAFVNPSNLAVVDEIAALTRKRIAPAVTTEIRILEAHQRFYGRHIPREFRSLLQKIERRTGQRRPVEGDVRESSRASKPIGREGDVGPGMTPGGGHIPTDSPASPSSPIAIASELDSMSPPDLPSFGSTRDDTSGPDDLLPTVPPPRPRRQSDPVAKLAGSAMPLESEDPIGSGEDSLTQWVGEALTSFQRDRGTESTPSASPPAPSSAYDFDREGLQLLSKGAMAAASPAGEDGISGMWRPSPLEDSDEGVSGMWTEAEETGSQLWEARSRKEIGEAVLQNALTSLPRVILFGAGKTAITGWRGRGPNLTAEEIASAGVSAAENSVFKTVELSGVPHFGLVDRADWPRALEPLLGPTPLDCAVFPVRILDGVAAFLYADRLGRPMQYADFALIARAAATTANELKRFLLRQKTPVG